MELELESEDCFLVVIEGMAGRLMMERLELAFEVRVLV
jgi:hypothetical protein